MRGPSSSHTAGSFHIGRVLRDLLGDSPIGALFTFDPHGSYAQTYRQQGVDLALATGLLGWSITDRRFPTALDQARKRGLNIHFRLSPLKNADHPNTVETVLKGKDGGTLRAMAKSTGGGTFCITSLDRWPVRLDGKAFALLVWGSAASKTRLLARISSSFPRADPPSARTKGNSVLFSLRSNRTPEAKTLASLAAMTGIRKIRTAGPVYHLLKGKPLFESAAQMVRAAGRKRWTLGQTALAYEATLLGMTKEEVLEEMGGRFIVMRESVAQGFRKSGIRMQLLHPSARKIRGAEESGELPTGGLHTRAAARAMAALHVSNSMGVVCAAPTGGSAGVLPAVIVTMAEEWNLSNLAIARALLAAGAIGLVLAKRATFAAEEAGCQVEIGAAGAMAAAAVVEASGGSAREAVDAAAIAFQNTMGSVCDLVQGMCEIPCHTRNAAAASNAFLCADLILGGYHNPIPLDETIDAVYDSGRMLPAELRCTARGGLAMTPSARKLPHLRKRRKR